MEKKTIRSGAPFVCAGAGVLLVALTLALIVVGFIARTFVYQRQRK